MTDVANEVYVRRLLPKGHGYPVYGPKPDDNLPQEYRDRGTSIGDLVLITADGTIDFLFNICLPRDHPVNDGRTPECFEMVDLVASKDLSSMEDWHGVGSSIASSSVKRKSLTAGVAVTAPGTSVDGGASFTFTSSSLEFAILHLQDGADRQDLRHLKKFREQALRHAKDWYNHANDTLGREVSYDSLYLVTGCDKCESWGIASHFDESLDNDVCLDWTAAPIAGGHASYGYSWANYSPATVRVGPDRFGRGQLGKKNQCVFIRGFKIAVREGPLAKIFGSVTIASIRESNAGRFLPDKSGPFARGGNSSSFRTGFSGGSSAAGYRRQSVRSDQNSEFDATTNDDFSVNYFPESSEPYHPSSVISGYLFDSLPEVDIVVTHDDVWCSVLEHGDTELPNDEELLRRINCEYRVATDAGGAFLVSSTDHEHLAIYLNASTLPSTPYDDHVNLDPQSFDNDSGRTDEDHSTGTCDPSSEKKFTGRNAIVEDGGELLARPDTAPVFRFEDEQVVENVVDAKPLLQSHIAHETAGSSILCRFPAEILENIALETVALVPLGPPSSIIPLICTCKHIYHTLALDQCPEVYARIFKMKFDLDAVRRRFGFNAVRSTNLAIQLQAYCITLRDIRRGDIYSPHTHDIMHTAFFIACENDGKNAHQLEWAGLGPFVDRFVRARLREDASQCNGWPAENSINALALWLMWFTTTQEGLAAESEQQRQEIIDLVLPYVILPFRYPSAYAPPNHFHLPLRTEFKQRYPHKVFTAYGPYPLYREPHNILEDVNHFGRFLEFSRPLVTIAAKLLYFSRREMMPIGILSHLPVDRAHATALGRTHVGPTQADVHEVNAHQSVKFVPRTRWDYWNTMSDEEKEVMDTGLWTSALASASSKWDNDWNRMTFCFNPWHNMPLNGVTYTHGMLNGLWQGRMLVPAQASLLGLTVTPHVPSTFGEGNPLITSVPLYMRLREHHCINPNSPVATGGKHDGFDDGLANAWLPIIRISESDGEVIITDEDARQSVYETYVEGWPNSHDEETCTACLSDKDKENAMCRRSASHLMPDIPPMDSDIEDIFDGCGLGASDDMDEDMDNDSDTEEVIHNSCRGIRDLLFTGETDISHGQAWNRYIFYGRVRRWDGLIALVRIPRHVNGNEHYPGRWVFSGYVVGAQNFVGTWRAIGAADTGIPALESAFTVSRRE